MNNGQAPVRARSGREVRLLALAGDIDALIAQIRLQTPLQALAARGRHALRCRSFHDCSLADLRQADVLIVQRGMSMRAARLQRQMRRQGGTVIYEIDDLLTELPEHVSNHRAVGRRQQALHACMAQADLVTVSTEKLGQALALPQWQVVPNYALPLGDARLPPALEGQAVTLLLASMEALAASPAIEAIRSLPPGAVRVVAVGPAAAGLAAAGLDVECHPLMPRRDFLDWVRALPNPVAVIPLEDSRFAACKSAIKWFEYGEAGVPVLCSDVSPYREVVDNGRTACLVANEVLAWRQALLAVIADSRWRLRLAQAARCVVRSRHGLELTAEAWERAIARAQQLRQQAAGRAIGDASRWIDALDFALDAARLPLRRLNRARLARRRRG